MDTSNTAASQSGESPEDVVATTEIFRAISDHYTHQSDEEEKRDVRRPAEVEGAQHLSREEQRPAVPSSTLSKESEKSRSVDPPPPPTQLREHSTEGSDAESSVSHSSGANRTTTSSSQARTQQRTNPYEAKLQESYNARNHETEPSSSSENNSSSRQSLSSSRSSMESSIPPPPSLRPAPRPGETPGATAVYPNNPLRQYGVDGMDVSGTTAGDSSNEESSSALSPSSPTPLIQARLVRESEIMYGNLHHHHEHHSNGDGDGSDDDIDTESGLATHAHSTDSSYVANKSSSNIMEAVKVVNEDEIIGRRKSFFYLLRDRRVIVVLVVLALAIIGLVVGLTVVKNDSDEELDNSPNSTLFLDPATIAENEEIANSLLAEIEAADGVNTFNPGTPQRLALNWLVNENILNGMEDFRIIQRFVLASLFFSSGGFNSWVNRSGWLSTKDECDWYQTDYFVGGSDKPLEHCDSEGHIRALVLGANGLGGTLPGGLGLFTKLEYLVMPSNVLFSPLPTLLPQLTDLVTIDLSSNVFAGTLPELAAGLKNITLDNNHFANTIPSSYAQMSSLEYLSLSSNHLNGTVPTGLAPTALFDIRNTDVMGEIPSSMCDTTAQVKVNCSSIACSCCQCE